MNASGTSKRILYLDLLRFVAILFVVNIHVSGSMLSRMGQEGVHAWWIANLSDAASRWAVPMFVMISGRLILSSPSSEEYHPFLKKRLIKVGIPLVIWSLVYYVYSLHQQHQPISSFSISDFLGQFASDSIYFHLWFLYMIIGLYLITPMLRIYTKHASNRNQLWLIVILFLGYNVSNVIGNLTGYTQNHGQGATLTSYLIPMQIYGAYYLLGAYLGKVELSRQARRWFYLAAILSYAIIGIGTYVVTTTGRFDELFYNDPTVWNIFISIGIFVFVKHAMQAKAPSATFSKWIPQLSALSLGIYLVHPIFMDVTDHIRLFGQPLNAHFINAIIGIPLTDIVVIIASGLFVYLVRKIPFVHYAIPG